MGGGMESNLFIEFFEIHCPLEEVVLGRNWGRRCVCVVQDLFRFFVQIFSSMSVVENDVGPQVCRR